MAQGRAFAAWDLNLAQLGVSVFSVLLLLVAGCGSSALDSRVEGVVTVAGKPLPCSHGRVLPGCGGPPAYGEIDAHGHYAGRNRFATRLAFGPIRVTVYAIGAVGRCRAL